MPVNWGRSSFPSRPHLHSPRDREARDIGICGLSPSSLRSAPHETALVHVRYRVPEHGAQLRPLRGTESGIRG